MAAISPIEIPAKLVFGVPGIAEVRRLVLRPGEVLMLRFNRHMDEAAKAEVTEHLQAVFGYDMRALILGPNVTDLEVISPEPGGM